MIFLWPWDTSLHTFSSQFWVDDVTTGVKLHYFEKVIS